MPYIGSLTMTTEVGKNSATTLTRMNFSGYVVHVTIYIRRFYFGSKTKAQCEPPPPLSALWKYSYLLWLRTYLVTYFTVTALLNNTGKCATQCESITTPTTKHT